MKLFGFVVTKLCIYIVFCCAIISILYSSAHVAKHFIQSNTVASNTIASVHIGTVSCRKPNETKSNEETLVMMKSVLISAMLHNIHGVTFHLFLEYDEDKLWFEKKVKEFYLDDRIEVSMMFYSAIEIVPNKYKQAMIYKPRFRCTYARLFFPKALQEVDSIVYVDTDIIVTGSIRELWTHFFKMNNEQLVGVVANNGPGINDTSKVHDCFPDVPYVHPYGLNAGFLLMNLTKMRHHGWEERLLKIFNDYSKVTKYLEDQRLLNILLYFDPGLLLLLPCYFNIRCSPCDHGFICNDTKDSFHGIHAVHGASGQFEKRGRFSYIYDYYKQFNLASGHITEDLINPIKTYPEERLFKKGESKCNVPINLHFYKNLRELE